MFTGIIETTGEIIEIIPHLNNRTFVVKSKLGPALKIDQSLSHNGVCLTIESIDNDLHQVTAIEETLNKTNLSDWKPGDCLNLERCVPMNGRLDGHIVQGHVDGLGTCLEIEDRNGSWLYTFSFDIEYAPLILEKGSICVNGTSLTCFNVTDRSFQVAIIPYTYEHTNIHQLKTGQYVNLEFDVVAKYLHRQTSLLQKDWNKNN
jgi:riboflavin synthase